MFVEEPDDHLLTLVAEKLGTCWEDFFRSLGVPPDRITEASREVPCVPHHRNRRLILEWKQNCHQSAAAMFTMLIGRLVDTCLEDLLTLVFPVKAASTHEKNRSPSAVEVFKISPCGEYLCSEHEC